MNCGCLFLAPEFGIELSLPDKPLPLPKCPVVLFPHLEQIDNRVIDSGSEFFRSIDVDWLEWYNTGILQRYKLRFDDFKCLVDTGKGLVNRVLVLSKWLSRFRLDISHDARSVCVRVRARSVGNDTGRVRTNIYHHARAKTRGIPKKDGIK